MAVERAAAALSEGGRGVVLEQDGKKHGLDEAGVARVSAEVAKVATEVRGRLQKVRAALQVGAGA